jgi:hypothetical protein
MQQPDSVYFTVSNPHHSSNKKVQIEKKKRYFFPLSISQKKKPINLILFKKTCKNERGYKKSLIIWFSQYTHLKETCIARYKNITELPSNAQVIEETSSIIFHRFQVKYEKLKGIYEIVTTHIKLVHKSLNIRQVGFQVLAKHHNIHTE